MRLLLLALPLTFVLPASACLNDRDSDSLALQAAKFPDTLRVITGRFERNPPLFYQMRIRRELAQLQKTPRDFNLYDDIAVAFDHLNRDDEALQIMAKKRAVLPPFDAKNPAQKEAWYRYFANAGTFHAHHYLSQKAGDLAEMKVARAMIKRAIEIKPNAHFGREKYQLLAMDWIVAEKKHQTTQDFGSWIEERDNWEDAVIADESPKRQQATQGLSGLIVLGAAWESPDIFEALAASLERRNGITLNYIALLRCREILESGKASQNPAILNVASVEQEIKGRPLDLQGIFIQKQNLKTLDELFSKLRAEAESWNAARQKYMLARLEKGDHPDTNPQFWNNYKPAAPPSLEVDWFSEKAQRAQISSRFTLRVVSAGVFLIAAITGMFVWRFRRAKYRRAV